MRTLPQWLFQAALPLTLLLAAGCSRQAPGPSGSAHISARFNTLSQTEAVTRVSIAVAGIGILGQISADLVKDGNTGAWSGTLTGIPSSPALTPHSFYASAYDSSGTQLYTGQATAPVAANQTTTVAMILTQVNGGTGFNQGAPVITGFVASSTEVTTLSSLEFLVQAVDPQSYPLSYSWTATQAGHPGNVGTFTAANATHTFWTAPATGGQVTISVTVAETAGSTHLLSSSASFSVSVTAATSGGVQVTVTLDDAPVITSISASDYLPQWGNTIDLAVAASQDQGEQIRYLWSNNCGAGDFVDATGTVVPADAAATSTPIAHLKLNAAGAGQTSCPIVVVAQNYDTSGQPLPGTSSGTLTITITAPLVPTLLPIIDQSLIDNADTKTTLATEFFGAPHSLQVNAHSPTDPAGGPPSKIIYANWRTNSGTLAITGNQNTATWSPGACAATGATATVTLYDTVTGLSRDFSWQIGTCAPRSCGAIKRQHPEWTTNTNDGVWAIDPDGTGPGAPMLVSCDMWRHGGGWQLVAAMGSQHLVLRTDTLDSATPMARPPNSLTPFCTRGNCPQFNPAAAYEHHDLRTFAAFGAAHTWRVEAAAPVNGTTSQQFTFFRATCTGASCTPAIAVGNWFGTLINSNYLLLNSGSALLAPNTHWIPTPPWVNSSGGTQFFAMFGYRNEAPPSGCTTGSCPCTTGGQTAVCLGSPGGIASGTYGVPSADTDLEDAVSYQPAGQLMNLWLRDDANPVVGTP